MPTFRYSKTIVANEVSNKLRIEFPDSGSYGKHYIDLPGTSMDFECTSEGEGELGTKGFLMEERTVIISKVVNAEDEDIIPNVNVNYYVNDRLVIEHSNKKSEDKTPRIILNLNFK